MEKWKKIPLAPTFFPLSPSITIRNICLAGNKILNFMFLLSLFFNSHTGTEKRTRTLA